VTVLRAIRALPLCLAACAGPVDDRAPAEPAPPPTAPSASLATSPPDGSAAATAEPEPQRPSAVPRDLAEVVAGYAAKVAASALFVSGRTLDSVMEEEFAPDRPVEVLVRPLLQFEVDRERRRVTARVGSASATAVACADPRLGCTLAHGIAPEVLCARAGTFPAAATPPAAGLREWPLGEATRQADPPAGVDTAALAAAVDAAFGEPESGPHIRTRAVVVVVRGRLVAERYAAGYDRTSVLPGWSMTKTLIGALVGIRVAEGKLDPAAELPVPEWQQRRDDPRRALRLEDLLRMSSGLRWREDYENPASEALAMLFRGHDYGAAQAAQPLESEPGQRYVYSSGTTNLVCRILRTSFASDAEYFAFPRRALFDRIGMHSAVLETDPSGTFVGSSFGYATARDWARFGMLWAQDGVWHGERILPADWVRESMRPGRNTRGRFGRHLWLNALPAEPAEAPGGFADLPRDLVHMSGYEGQYVAVFPKEQIVAVRLGCTKRRRGFDLHGFLRSVFTACGGALASADAPQQGR
jgi:CubicO group peptidase (beta-lactamase class C family)